MASICKEKGHEVIFIDANAHNYNNDFVWEQIQSNKPEVVVFHAGQESFENDLVVGTCAKEVGAKSVCISWTFRTMAEEIRKDLGQSVDSLVVSHNYLELIPNMIDNGSFPEIVNYEPKMVFDELPFPDWSLIDNFKIYHTRVPSISPYTVTQSAVGCPNHCLFCNYRKTGWNARSPEHVVDELEILVNKYHVKYVHFYDATFNISEKRVMQISEEIIARKLKFKWFINARADHWNMLSAGTAKEAGLDGVSLGIESNNQNLLDEMKKGTTVEDNRNAITTLKKAGIKTNLSCMIGFPSETEETIMDLVKFLKWAKPSGFFISPYGMCSVTGTYWFEEYRKQGADLPHWSKLHDWGNWLSFCKYSPQELQEIRKKMYREITFKSWYIPSNFWWMIKHPSDMKMGIEFGFYHLYKLLKGLKNYR
jgi:radical SAM superfamily enzyme YgiQ (UPF0313 family)